MRFADVDNDEKFDNPDFDFDDLVEELEYEMEPTVIREKWEESSNTESARFAKFNSEDWWNGTLESVDQRIADLIQWRNYADDEDVRNMASHQISKLATFREEVISREYINSLPGETKEVIAPSIGEDDNTSLYAAAKAVESEVQNYDWRHFITEGAKQWTEIQPVEVIANTDILRESAYNYATSYTSMLNDEDESSRIASKFVENVSYYAQNQTCSLEVYLFNNRHGVVAVAAGDMPEAAGKYREATGLNPHDDFKRTAVLNNVPIFGTTIEDFGGVEIYKDELFLGKNTERWGFGPYGFLFVR